MDLQTDQKHKIQPQDKVKDKVRFLKSWAKRPLAIGAISPSGRSLAATMARMADPNSLGPVIELGPGTGVMTRALLEHGVAAKRIVAIEANPEFAALLKQRFPACTILQADAYRLKQTLADHGVCHPGIVISSLPLLMRSLEWRVKLITDALQIMPTGACFIQFSYGLTPPVKVDHLPLPCLVSKSRWVISNLPPARVWRYCLPAH